MTSSSTHIYPPTHTPAAASRSTVEILRKHVMGYKPVYMETVSDASAVLTSSHAFNRVNWEDPHYNVGLPVFAIHGNHDDPIREGGKVRPPPRPLPCPPLPPCPPPPPATAPGCPGPGPLPRP